MSLYLSNLYVKNEVNSEKIKVGVLGNQTIELNNDGKLKLPDLILIDNKAISATGSMLIFNNSLTVNQENITPVSNNNLDLGSSDKSFNDIFYNGNIYNSSDSRLKKDINDNVPGLDFVLKLHPVNYTMINNEQRKSGFIAQEVEDIVKTNNFEFNGVLKPEDTENQYYKVAYDQFISTLVKSIQELNRKIDDLYKKNN